MGDSAWSRTWTLDLSVPPSLTLPVCTGTEPLHPLGGPGHKGSWQNSFLLSCFGNLPLKCLGPVTLTDKTCQVCLFQPRSPWVAATDVPLGSDTGSTWSVLGILLSVYTVGKTLPPQTHLLSLDEQRDSTGARILSLRLPSQDMCKIQRSTHLVIGFIFHFRSYHYTEELYKVTLQTLQRTCRVTSIMQGTQW